MAVSESYELLNLKMARGTPVFVASLSVGRVILRTSELEAGVRREGGLMGLLPPTLRFA